MKEKSIAKVKTSRMVRKKPAAKKGINEGELAKINCVEGQQALDSFVNLTRQLLSVPKSEIVEMERNRKKKT